jgi:hypothetical protein
MYVLFCVKIKLSLSLIEKTTLRRLRAFDEEMPVAIFAPLCDTRTKKTAE